ncbi:MAG: putative outer membrane protein OmpA family [Fibrobacteres bacterium]|nr:putative outer membrane protein OmpA family [Fibrobacterota bacterium]
MKSPLWLALCLLLGNPLVTHSQSDSAGAGSTGADSALAAYKSWLPPSNTFYALNGLSQTSSAEAVGLGRLVIGLTGTWYQQQRTFPGAPPKDGNIFSGIGAASFGLNRFVDLFASLSGYGTTNYTTDSGSGLGVVGGGLHGTLPTFQSSPLWLAAEVGVYQGISENPIDFNHADGYDYFETRTDLDFMVKLLQTLAVGEEAMGIKIHANEGIVTSTESGKDPLMLLAAGAQMNLLTMILGIEAHSRTFFDDIDLTEDPVWFTPSVQFRTPFDLNLSLGADFSVASTRSDSGNTRALEPWRLFAGLAFTFDTQAGKKREAAAKAKQEAMAKAQLEMKVDTLAMKQDSLTRQAAQDSMALVESQKSLQEERAKRTAAENQLLNTGMLLLDTVYFQTGNSVLSLNSKPYLKVIATMLTKYPKLQIEVAGHTDNVGGAEYNQRLSQSRAQAVAAYLIDREPSLKGTVTAKGYGETQPVADNATEDGRKLNRRTELRVLNRVALKEYNP